MNIKKIASAVSVALALSTSSAFALPIINATVAGTWTTSWTSNGSGGNITRWRINNLDDLVGTEFEWIDKYFYAMCMEPRENRSSGYFELVDLWDAPTNPGGMGVVKATAIERIISNAGWNSFGDLIDDRATRTAMSMIGWESSQEGSDTYDRRGGTYTIRSYGAAEAAAIELEDLMDVGPITVDAYGMVSTQPIGEKWVSNHRQDFMFFNPDGGSNSVPEPMSMMLMSIGMLGMVGARMFKKVSS